MSNPYPAPVLVAPCLLQEISATRIADSPWLSFESGGFFGRIYGVTLELGDYFFASLKDICQGGLA